MWLIYQVFIWSKGPEVKLGTRVQLLIIKNRFDSEESVVEWSSVTICGRNEPCNSFSNSVNRLLHSSCFYLAPHLRLKPLLFIPSPGCDSCCSTAAPPGKQWSHQPVTPHWDMRHVCHYTSHLPTFAFITLSHQQLYWVIDTIRWIEDKIDRDTERERERCVRRSRCWQVEENTAAAER